MDWAIDTALDCGLMVVLDMHHFDENFQDPNGEKARFLAMWKQIATRYQSYSDNLIFEILNEPNTNLTTTIWNDFLEKAIDTIRQTNPDRTLIVGCANWGNLSALNDLDIPPGEDNVIVTVHYYEPFPFTHQGAEWTTPSYPVGTTWDGTTVERNAVTSHFNSIKSWSVANNIPVYIGEFGSYEKADMASRRLWTDCVARACEANDFSWSYWEFCSSFGAYNDTTRTWRTALLNALMPLMHTVSITQPSNGTIQITPQKEEYSYGENVMVTASGNTGYVLDSWTGDLVGRVNPYSFTVIGDYSISAVFTEDGVDTTVPSTVLDDFEVIDTVNSLTHDWFYYSDRSNSGNSAITNATMVDDTTWSAPVAQVMPDARDASLNGMRTSFEMGSVRPTDGGYKSDYSARIDYTLDIGDLEHNPFVGFGVTLNEDGDPVDISTSTGIDFWYKSNKSFRVECVTDNIDDYTYYYTDIPAASGWTHFQAGWNSFVQPDWGDSRPFDLSGAINIQFIVQQTDGTTGSIFIDDLKIPDAPGSDLVDDCEDGDGGTLWGGGWYSFNDSNDDGESSVAPLTDESTPFVMSSTGSPFPNYIGVGTGLAANDAVLDITGVTAVSFWAKASEPMVVTHRLGTGNITDYGFYEERIALTTDWIKYVIPVSSMAQPEWATPASLDLTQAKLIDWQLSVEENPLLDEATGEFWLDDVVLIGYESPVAPPSLSVSPTSFTGSTVPNTSVVVTSILENISADAVTIDSVRIVTGGTILSMERTIADNTSFTAGYEDSLKIEFYSPAIGIFTGTVLIFTDEMRVYPIDLEYNCNLPVNNPPSVAGSIPDITVAEDHADTVHADLNSVFNDIEDGNKLSFAVKSNNTDGAVTVAVNTSDSTLVLGFAADAVVADGQIIIEATDSEGAACTDTFYVTVTPVNDRPVISDVTEQSVDEDDSITITLSMMDTNDPDGDVLTLIVSNGSDYAVANSSTVIPREDFSGKLKVPVKVSDGTLFSNEAEMTITVTAVNDIPVISAIENQTVNEDDTLTITASMMTIEDVDNTTFIITAGSGSNYTVADGSNVIPDPDFSGDLAVPVTVSDGTDSSSPVTVTISVTPVNDAPVLVSVKDTSIEKNTAITITSDMISANDVENEQLQILLKGGDNYSVSGNTVIAPSTDYIGTLLVPVTVFDGKDTSNSIEMTITVTDVPNSLPEIQTAEKDTVTPGEEYEKEFKCTDADGDEIVWQKLDGPEGSKIHARDGIFSWRVSEDSAGKDITVKISVADTHGGADTVTYTFVVEQSTAIHNLPMMKAEKEMDFHFVFGPNPVRMNERKVHFTCPVNNVAKVTLSIFDATGNRIHFKKINTRSFRLKSTGTWNLETDRGRTAAKGTYLAILSVLYKNGKKENFKTSVGIK